MLNPWIRLGWPAKSSETRLITPGVSILPQSQCIVWVEVVEKKGVGNERLALEIFHDVEKLIIHLRVLVKLDLDLVEVTESILVDVQVSKSPVARKLLEASRVLG